MVDATQRVAPKMFLRRAISFAATADAAGADARQRFDVATLNAAERSDKNNLVNRWLFIKATALKSMEFFTAPNVRVKPRR